MYYYKLQQTHCFCTVSRLSCPPRKDAADWLVELTGTAGASYRADPAERMALGLGKVPVTAEEFHAKWLESDGGKFIEKVWLRLRFCRLVHVRAATWRSKIRTCVLSLD